MAFWKIYRKKSMEGYEDFKNVQPINILEGKDNIFKYLKTLPNVRNVELKEYGAFTGDRYFVFYNGGSNYYRDADQFVAFQYKPTQEELNILRPKKKYVALPKKEIGIKVGDIYYTSWGYDQTNIDTIIITEVSETGKTVKARRCKTRTLGNEGSHDLIEPTRQAYGDTFRLQVRTYNRNGVEEYGLTGSYAYSNGSMDNSRVGSFTKYTNGQRLSETNSYYGH